MPENMSAADLYKANRDKALAAAKAKAAQQAAEREAKEIEALSKSSVERANYEAYLKDARDRGDLDQVTYDREMAKVKKAAALVKEQNDILNPKEEKEDDWAKGADERKKNAINLLMPIVAKFNPSKPDGLREGELYFTKEVTEDYKIVRYQNGKTKTFKKGDQMPCRLIMADYMVFDPNKDAGLNWIEDKKVKNHNIIKKYSSFSEFPLVGQEEIYYRDKETNDTYIWGSAKNKEGKIYKKYIKKTLLDIQRYNLSEIRSISLKNNKENKEAYDLIIKHGFLGIISQISLTTKNYTGSGMNFNQPIEDPLASQKDETERINLIKRAKKKIKEAIAGAVIDYNLPSDLIDIEENLNGPRPECALVIKNGANPIRIPCETIFEVSITPEKYNSKDELIPVVLKIKGKTETNKDAFLADKRYLLGYVKIKGPKSTKPHRADRGEVRTKIKGGYSKIASYEKYDDLPGVTPTKYKKRENETWEDFNNRVKYDKELYPPKGESGVLYRVGIDPIRGYNYYTWVGDHYSLVSDPKKEEAFSGVYDYEWVSPGDINKQIDNKGILSGKKKLIDTSAINKTINHIDNIMNDKAKEEQERLNYNAYLRSLGRQGARIVKGINTLRDIFISSPTHDNIANLANAIIKKEEKGELTDSEIQMIRDLQSPKYSAKIQTAAAELFGIMPEEVKNKILLESKSIKRNRIKENKMNINEIAEKILNCEGDKPSDGDVLAFAKEVAKINFEDITPEVRNLILGVIEKFKDDAHFKKIEDFIVTRLELLAEKNYNKVSLSGSSRIKESEEIEIEDIPEEDIVEEDPIISLCNKIKNADKVSKKDCVELGKLLASTGANNLSVDQLMAIMELFESDNGEDLDESLFNLYSKICNWIERNALGNPDISAIDPIPGKLEDFVGKPSPVKEEDE